MPARTHLGVAFALAYRGLAALEEGKLHEARTFVEECLTLATHVEEKLTLAFGLDCCARFAIAQGDFHSAAKLLSASANLVERLGGTIPPSEKPIHDEFRATLNTALGEADFRFALTEGESMTEEEAMEFALQMMRRR